MAIQKKFSPTTGRRPVAGRTAVTASRRPVTAASSITAGVKSRQNSRAKSRINANLAGLTPAQARFAQQIMANCRSVGTPIMGATNRTAVSHDLLCESCLSRCKSCEISVDS